MSELVTQDTAAEIAMQLRDGTAVRVRYIRPNDTPLLQDFYSHLSPQSIYFRFLASWKELTSERADSMTHVDYKRRMAFVAIAEREGREQLIGFASYVMTHPIDAGTAEAAVIVSDEYQGLGLGTILLEQLASYARTWQIHTFVGTVHSENQHMLRWLENRGLWVEVNSAGEDASELLVQVELGSDVG